MVLPELGASASEQSANEVPFFAVCFQSGGGTLIEEWIWHVVVVVVGNATRSALACLTVLCCATKTRTHARVNSRKIVRRADTRAVNREYIWSAGLRTTNTHALSIRVERMYLQRSTGVRSPSASSSRHVQNPRARAPQRVVLFEESTSL